MQIRDYYNKTELPPYGEYEAETSTQVVTLTPEGPQVVGHTAPNLRAITIDVDMESDPAAAGTQDVTVIPSDYQNGAHQQDQQTAATLQLTGTHGREHEQRRIHSDGGGLYTETLLG